MAISVQDQTTNSSPHLIIIAAVLVVLVCIGFGLLYFNVIPGWPSEATPTPDIVLPGSSVSIDALYEKYGIDEFRQFPELPVKPGPMGNDNPFRLGSP